MFSSRRDHIRHRIQRECGVTRSSKQDRELTIELEWIGEDRLGNLELPKSIVFLRPLLQAYQEGSITNWIANVKTEFRVLRWNDSVFPVTINSSGNSEDVTSGIENSYVVSPYASAARYPIDELKFFDSRFRKAGIKTLVHALAPILRMARIDNVVSVNNWLLSTNLYPAQPVQNLATLVAKLCREFPANAIMFRSLSPTTNAKLIEGLTDCGFRMIPSRLVYFFDVGNDWKRKKDSRRDCRLLETQSAFQCVDHGGLEASDDAEMKNLYDQLYLRKYSQLNPQFSEEQFRLWRESKMLDFTGFRNHAGKLVGIIGRFVVGDTVTAPVVGYDLRLPQKLGVYRMLMTAVIASAQREQKLLNLSSGAGRFKRLRGGRPEIEFTAVYVNHLSRAKRTVWRNVETLFRKIGVPMLRKFDD